MASENAGFISYKNSNTILAETVCHMKKLLYHIHIRCVFHIYIYILFPNLQSSIYSSNKNSHRNRFKVYQFLYGMVYGAAWGCVRIHCPFHSLRQYRFRRTTLG